MQAGWCHLYPEDTRNPYVPIAAKGPWIVTMHGAVLHDNGGYGMLGFGHSPDMVLKAMSTDVVMANIMTPNLGQKKFIDAIRNEIGHNRADGKYLCFRQFSFIVCKDPNLSGIKNYACADKFYIGGVSQWIFLNQYVNCMKLIGCPYASFLLMNSGSEGNSVADRLIDIHTGEVMSKKDNQGKKVKCLALKGCFHGRTYRPALWTDACKERYFCKKNDCYFSLHAYD